MADQAVVSIIIPVYNTEAYLRPCLESVAAQTYTAWEAICVDDGSTDGSLAILREYADRDPRFRIIQQDNRGAGTSRNTGMQAACGKYLYFIDADDFLVPDTLETVVTACEKEQAQIALFAFYRVNADDGKIISRGRVKTELLPRHTAGDCYRFNPADTAEILFRICRIAPWNRILNREFVIQTGILFEERTNSNDVFFTQMTLTLADRVIAMDLPLYNYRVNVNNSLQRKKDADPCQFIEARLSTRAELIRRGLLPRYEKAWQDDFAGGCVFTLNSTHSRAVLRQIHQRLLRQDVAETGALSRKLPPLLESFIKGPDIFASAEERAVKILHSNSLSTSPSVSVVVPVCSSVSSLQDSVKSLLAQTLSSIEIVCVCDGTDESCLEAVLSLAREDERITVITESLSGLGAARNTGLAHATGKYIYFCDIGTQLDRSALEALYRRAEEAGTDVLFFEADRSAKNTCRYVRTGESVKNGRDFFLHAYGSDEFTSSVCLQFLNRNFLLENSLLFEEGVFATDESFTVSALLCARSVSVIKKALLRGCAAISESDGTCDLLLALSRLSVYCACRRKTDRYELEPEIKASFEKYAEACRKRFLRLYNRQDADFISLLKMYCSAEQRAVLDEVESFAHKNQSVLAGYWDHFLNFFQKNGFRVTVNRIVIATFSKIRKTLHIK